MPDVPLILEQAKTEVSPMTGAGIDRVLGEVYALPPELIEKAKAALKN